MPKYRRNQQMIQIFTGDDFTKKQEGKQRNREGTQGEKAERDSGASRQDSAPHGTTGTTRDQGRPLGCQRPRTHREMARGPHQTEDREQGSDATGTGKDERETLFR